VKNIFSHKPLESLCTLQGQSLNELQRSFSRYDKQRGLNQCMYIYIYIYFFFFSESILRRIRLAIRINKQAHFLD